MGELFVKDFMTTGVVHVTAADTVERAIDVMTERNISCVVVTESEESSRPLGLITERDLLRRVLKKGLNPKKTLAKDIMTSSLVTISEEATLEEAMRTIEGMKIRRLPVINAAGVVGLITQTDIVKETYNIHKSNMRLAFHQTIQSYVIIALAVVFVVAFLIRMVG